MNDVVKLAQMLAQHVSELAAMSDKHQQELVSLVARHADDVRNSFAPIAASAPAAAVKLKGNMTIQQTATPSVAGHVGD